MKYLVNGMTKKSFTIGFGILGLIFVVVLFALPSLSKDGAIRIKYLVTVTDDQGNPVEGASVLNGDNPENAFSVAITDSQGRAEFSEWAYWGAEGKLHWENHVAGIMFDYIAVSKDGFKTVEVDMPKRWEWKEIFGISIGRPDQIGGSCVLIEETVNKSLNADAENSAG